MKKATFLSLIGGVILTLSLSSCDFLSLGGSTDTPSSESSLSELTSEEESNEDSQEESQDLDTESSEDSKSSSSGEQCTHQWSSSYQYDSNNHYLVCLLCGEISNYESHNLEQVSKDPTCVDYGYSASYCTVCDYYTYQEVSPTGEHIYEGEGVVTKEPTCQTEGERTWTCSICKEATKVETIAKLQHDFTSESSEYGKDENYHWRICGNEGCNQISEKVLHDFKIEGDIDRSPSCTEVGSQIVYCECGYSSAKELEATGHTPGDQVEILKEATCTETGYWSYVCAVCSEPIEAEPYGPLGHEYYDTYDETTHFQKCSRCEQETEHEEHIYTSENSLVTKDANCTETGNQDYYCLKCDYIYHATLETNEVHDYQVVSRTEPTCQVEGFIYYECSRCRSTYQQSLGYGEHNWDSSYTSDSDYHWFKCLNDGCNEIKDKEAHDYIKDDKNSKAPSCEEDGISISNCKCGKTIEQVESATGHTWGEWTQTLAPTCEESGTQTRQCETCNLKEEMSIDPLGHDYTVQDSDETGHWMVCSRCSKKDETSFQTHTESRSYQAATCTEDGYEKIVCSVCNYLIKDETFNALGHSFVQVAVYESTCVENGYIEYECSLCGARKQEQLALADHTLGDYINTEESAHYKECSVCHEVFEKEAHSLTASFSDGKWVNTCSVCGYKEDTKLDSKYVIVGDFEGDSWSLAPKNENLILEYSSLYTNTKIWSRTIQFAPFNRQAYDPSFRICEYDESESSWVTIADYTNVDLTSSTDGFKDHYDGEKEYNHNIEGYWGGTYTLEIDCTSYSPTITITYHEDGFIRGTVLGVYAIYGTFGDDDSWNAYPEKDSPYYLEDTGDLYWEKTVTLKEDESGYSGFRIVNYGTFDAVVDARNLTSTSTGVSVETSGDYNILGTYGFTYDLIIDMRDEDSPSITVTLIDDDDYMTKYGNLTLNITIEYDGTTQTVPEYADLYYAGSTTEDPTTGVWGFEKASVSEENPNVYQIKLTGTSEGWYGFRLLLDYKDDTSHLDGWTYKVNSGSENEYFELRANDFSKGYKDLVVESDATLESIIPDPTLGPAENVTFSITVQNFNTYGWQVYIIGTFNDDDWTNWYMCEYNGDTGSWDYTFSSLKQGRVAYKIVMYESSYTPTPGVWGQNRYQSIEDIEITISEASTNTTFYYNAIWPTNMQQGY